MSYADTMQAREVSDPLPTHLEPYWGGLLVDPRTAPAFCPRQSHKTPAIPWHNGTPCLSCGRTM